MFHVPSARALAFSCEVCSSVTRSNRGQNKVSSRALYGLRAALLTWRVARNLARNPLVSIVIGYTIWTCERFEGLLSKRRKTRLPNQLGMIVDGFSPTAVSAYGTEG